MYDTYDKCDLICDLYNLKKRKSLLEAVAFWFINIFVCLIAGSLIFSLSQLLTGGYEMGFTIYQLFRMAYVLLLCILILRSRDEEKLYPFWAVAIASLTLAFLLTARFDGTSGGEFGGMTLTAGLTLLPAKKERNSAQ